MSARTQEVRVALTMTGGVSLAIWMGGVARELNLLSQASDRRRLPDASFGDLGEDDARIRDLYGRLLDLLDVVVETDVLSGTSAGGINAVLLARARARGLDLAPLRETWLELGALEDLLRDPSDDAVPSLMQGDGKLYAGLVQALAKIDARQVRPAITAPSTTLHVMTTLLSGEESTFQDALGTVVPDVDHRGVLVFDTKALESEDQDSRARLALAGRSTASFPGAFEPSFLPYDASVPKEGASPGRPAMKDVTRSRRAHWVADGGLVDNQPLDLVLEKVFERPAKRDVRRLLLYVVPTTGQPVPVTERWDAPPGSVDALLADLRAVTAQSTAGDLRAITRHNEAVRHRADTRVQLAALANRLARDASGAPPRLLTPDALQKHIRVARDASARLLARALRREVVRTSSDGSSLGGRAVPLAPDAQVDVRCRRAIAKELPDDTPTQVPSSVDDLVPLDRRTFDAAVAAALDVAHRAARLALTPEERGQCATLVDEIHKARPDRLQPLTEVAAEVARESSSTPEQAAASLVAKRQELARVPAAQWLAVGRSLHERLGDLWALAEREPGGAGSEAESLQTLLTYLGDGTEEELTLRLVDLAILAGDVTGNAGEELQPVELVQLSADTRSALAASRAVATRKLTGLQLHHFGAFYKKSWRANDWLWGRVDGAGWLVHVLLDPRRIRVVVDAAETTAVRSEWFLGMLRTLFPGAGEPSSDVLDELAYLDRPDRSLPSSLPNTATWLAGAWQHPIAAAELPIVAGAVLGDASGTADWSPNATRTWAAEAQHLGGARGDDGSGGLPDSAVGRLLDASPVADETLATDRVSPLLRRTITKAAATGAAALVSTDRLPKVVTPALTTLRTITLAAHRVVNRVGRTGARVFLAAGLAVLVLGIAAAVQESTVFGLTGLVATVVGAYMVVLATWQLSRRALGVLGGATLVIAVFALTLPAVRGWLFGRSADTQGLIAQHLSWFGAAWWHPLTALGVLLLLSGLIAVVLAPRAPTGRRST